MRSIVLFAIRRPGSSLWTRGPNFRLPLLPCSEQARTPPRRRVEHRPMDWPFQVSLRDALRSPPAAFPRGSPTLGSSPKIGSRRRSPRPSGPVEQTVLRVVGVALPGSRTLHLSDPSLSHLTGGREVEPLSGILDVPSLPLDAWASSSSARLRPRRGACRRFHQNVWVAGRDAVAEDSRRAAESSSRAGCPGVSSTSSSAPPRVTTSFGW